MRAIQVRESSQVGEGRREAVKLARAHGFSEEDAGRVAIVATELGANLVKHGGGGELLIGGYEDRTGAGIECLALDKGPGMADVAIAMRDGHSTAGSPGTGLGAVRRASHAFDIFSTPGAGTAILARLEPRARGKDCEQPDYGAVSLAMQGEEACGDAWRHQRLPDGIALMVSDGLGHGPFAAEASLAAIRSFAVMAGKPPSEAMSAMHSALKPTRGAAIAIAQLDREAKRITYAGVGNIAGSIVGRDGSTRRMLSYNGIVGHVAKQIREVVYPLENDPLVILASDGLGTSWALDAYPGLFNRHPTLIAAVLYRDFTRGRDDVTVLVARGGEV